MATILDVETKSGVSRSTISRYLNGKNVTEDNRIRIEKAVEELSYKLNPMASGLKTSITHTIGCVLPDITDPFFPPIIKAFQKYMREHGYQTILNNYGNDNKLEIDQVSILANKRVDGLVIATSCSDGAHIQECLDNGLPVVMLDRLINELECDCVTVDNYSATYDAISMAIRKGHTDIAFIRGQEVYTDKMRFAGYRDALANNGVALKEEYVVRADIVEHDATRQFMRLLSLKSPPTLIFCSNVYLAMGAFEAMVEYKLDIPKEVSVITFDRLSAFPFYGFMRSIKPEFTSIYQPLEQVGIQTAKTMLKRLKHGMDNYQPMVTEMKTSFEITDSVADIV